MTLYPATITRRFWAFVLDYAIVIILNISFISMFGDVLGRYAPTWLQVVAAIIYVMGNVFYLPLSEMILGGATIGKLALKIRVVRTDGSPVTPVHSLQRFLMMFVDLIGTFGLGGLVSALISGKRQRIGDIVADTIVVRVIPSDDSGYILPTLYVDDKAKEQASHYAAVDSMISSYMASPLELAKEYRAMECEIATARTYKEAPQKIDYLERLLCGVHLAMFKQRSHTIIDTFVFMMKSVPKAVYSARYAIYVSIFITVIAYAIGIYSQNTDTDFFREVMGEYYADMTIENMKQGNPTGVYASENEWEMFASIFMNNLFVSMRLYVLGLVPFFGPLFMMLMNFVSFASFDAFFAQQGFLADALITPNEHGVLELSTIVMNGGAAILLGTGWLFPGKLTRRQAWARSARHSLLVFISTIPILFVAAVIESFVTRHTEWPMALKLSIIIISAIIIIGYYVVLPIYSKRH